MKHLVVSEITILSATIVSGQVGLFLLINVCLYFHNKLGIYKASRQRQVDFETSPEIKSQIVPEPQRMADSLFPYKGCLIKIYGNTKTGKFRIMMPSGKDLGKEFPTYLETTREIDIVAPFLQVNLPK